MVEGKFKSRTYRRVKTRIPGGKTVTHYSKRKLSVPKCAVCKETLKGIKVMTAKTLKQASKSEKNTNRPFGGYLCSACARKVAKNIARQ